ncbi:FG-GAP-like repeat-containing protein [Streptomyces sp. NPDC005786]|uniref:FG-GAP-like repeat-containing protein n=1 Tax=Streptomyces sp. NPDC005786 TaxID=3154891 RepID=UPI00340DE8C5
MRDHTSRRALRLASALVAAGLALTAAPHALATTGDDGSATKLTSRQADGLATRMGVDVYGDNLEPVNAGDGASGDTDGNDDAPVSGLDSAAADASTPVTFTETSYEEGVHGVGATVPAGSDGSYFTVHSLGNVQLHKADGSTAWARSNLSLYTDWQVKPQRVWQAQPYPARVMMGYNAVSPFTPASDQGFDTADLTGDGTPDLVFSADVGTAPYRPITSPGSTLSTGTFVTVLDGRSGNTLWSKLYAQATAVKVVDGTLLVGNAPAYNQNAPVTETATLTGIRFSYADGALTPSATWTYDTQHTEAAWGALESIGDGKAAVSWNVAKTGSTPGSSRTLVLDAADGSVTWHTDSTLYGRQLHLDASRGRIVALEQADSTDGIGYEIVSYALGTGARVTLDSRSNVLPTAMTIGDLKGTRKTEYAVAESALDANLGVNASTVRVLDGTSPDTALWSHTTKRDAANSKSGPSVWRLDMLKGRLVASAQTDKGINTADNAGGGRLADLTVFDANGSVSWEHRDTSASPMFQQVFSDRSGAHVRVVDLEQNVRDFSLAKGTQRTVTPLQADLAYAAAVDVDGDKRQDVVAGGTSHGVWAYDGGSLLTGKPKKLWEAAVAGRVHAIETGDVTGDSRPEIIVAADTATVVLDARTGKTLTTIDGGGAYVRSVTVADVNGTGKDEILVPTDALRAYNGNGKKLWQYTAPAGAGDVVFSDTTTGDGRVYTQYTSLGAMQLDTATVDGVALNGKNGDVRWTAAPKAPAQAVDGKLHGALLDHAVYASPDIPYADGHAVVYTWIVRAEPDFGSTAAPAPTVVVEIRDGRTGEVLHQSLAGSPWSHGGFFTGGPGGALHLTAYGTIFTYGADGQDRRGSTIPPVRSAQFITGPDGRTLLGNGYEGGVGAWDPSMLDGGVFRSALGKGLSTGGRNCLAVDLDGDGAQEMISLAFDETGYDRMAQELGSRVLFPDSYLHKMATFKLS